MGRRVGSCGRGRRPRKVGNQGNVGNQNGNVVNENIQENVRNVLVNSNRIEKMRYVEDMIGCSIDQKVKYIAGSFMEEFCPSHEMQKLKTELWNHDMVGAGHVAYTDRFHELARLVPHLVTPESRKIERYVYGLALQMRGMVAAMEPKTIQKAVQIFGIEPIKLGFIYEIKIASGQLVEIDKVIKSYKLEIEVLGIKVFILSTAKLRVSTAKLILVLLNDTQKIAKYVSTAAALEDCKSAGCFSTSITYDVNTAYGVSTASTQVNTASTQVSTANLSDATVYAYLANQPNRSQLVHKDLEQIHEDDLEEIDLKWQLALLSIRAKMFFLKTRKKITINRSDTAGYDKFKVECYNCHKMGHFVREYRGTRNHDSRCRNQESSRRIVNVEETSSKAMVAIDGVGFDWSYMAEDKVPTNMAFMASSDSEKEKDDIGLKIEKLDNASKSLDKLIGSQITDKSKKGLGYVSYNAVPPPHTGRFSPPKLDLSHTGLLEFVEPSVESYEVKSGKVVTKSFCFKKSKTVRESNDEPLIKECESDREDEVKSPLRIERKTIKPSVGNVEVVKPNQQENPTRKPIKYSKMLAAITLKGKAWPNSAVVNAVRANQDNTGHPQKELEDEGYVDSGYSRHIIGNMSYLIDFKEFNGGYVAFERGAKGEKITSVSQMCDKKNNVLFTNTECFVLSPNFKLSDESQVLLKVPRKNNMYSVDINNIVPKESLTCLVAKATLDESMLWHRRLGHVNFKTINKLVKENLVRATKDETSGVLKSFITQIENLVDKKLKIIRCDNGTKFKNKVMHEFCGKKGIKKEYSVAKTPHQNGKFEGKADDGFFIGYSMNSKDFRVYNIRTRKVEENLRIEFLENKPIIAGTNFNDFTGTKASIGAGQSSMEIGPSQDYILMPLWNDGSLFDFSSKNSDDDGPPPSSDAGKKDDEGPSKESGIDDQERPEYENNTKDINTAGPSINTASINVNTGSPNINIVSLTANTVRSSGATYDDFFSTEADMISLDEIKVDMSNITTTYPVPYTPNKRVHKDHSLGNVIGDVQSGVQTRRMTKTTNEQGFISAIYEGKTHEDLHTCLLACFLSQEEPKRIIKALSDPAWVEVMQEEILHF
nr:hypothetical protein [Tanacetum cinerariifolium]